MQKGKGKTGLKEESIKIFLCASNETKLKSWKEWFGSYRGIVSWESCDRVRVKEGLVIIIMKDKWWECVNECKFIY